MVGILASTVSGYLAIGFLFCDLRTQMVNAFGWYRIALSLFLLALSAIGVVQPLDLDAYHLQLGPSRIDGGHAPW